MFQIITEYFRNDASLAYVFAKDNQGLEDGRQVEHEAGVVPEALDVAFVAGVEENRTVGWIKPIIFQQQKVNKFIAHEFLFV